PGQAGPTPLRAAAVLSWGNSNPQGVTMPAFRPHIRLRTFLVLVAASSVLVWAVEGVAPWAYWMWVISRGRTRRADEFSRSRCASIVTAEKWEFRALLIRHDPDPDGDHALWVARQRLFREGLLAVADEHRLRAEYYAEMDRYYRKAAIWPW